MCNKKETCIYYYQEKDCFGDTYDCCYREMPDSKCDCEGVCKFFEEDKTAQLTFDLAKEVYEKQEEHIAIEGVGKDAEIVVNENGGKQSKTPMALHLVDPEYIRTIAFMFPNGIYEALTHIAFFMIKGDRKALIDAITYMIPSSESQKIIYNTIRIAKVLQEGVDKYEPNNWRLIPQEQHINHALIHLFAATLGDTQDNHLDHALCRLMMAYATKPSENFSYTEYIGKSK